MQSLSIATWNINSVRLRQGLVVDYLKAHQPDVLCLQEIKCRTGEFPLAPFAELGYVHHHIEGQKGWHGVATLSRHPVEPLPNPAFCHRAEARVAATRVRGVDIHNLYVPAGGDIPDPGLNEKFAHKLDFLGRMKEYYGTNAGRNRLVVVGDLNVAPSPHDVWSHKQLLDVVSHTPIETTLLDSIRDGGGFIDAVRAAAPEPASLFSWWSYRSADWTKNDRGRRLDHVWATPDLAQNVEAMSILREARSWAKPSDHVPVQVTFRLPA